MFDLLRSWFAPTPQAGALIDSPAISAAPDFRQVRDVLPPVTSLPDYINLDDAVRKVNDGRLLPITDQRFAGCCTAAAWAGARRLSRANSITDPRSWTNPSIEWLYGMARTRVWKPNTNPPGTGLGDIALIAKTIGLLECGQYFGIDLRFYNPKTALAWERTGPPDQLIPRVGPKVESLLACTEDDVLRALSARMAVAFSARWYWTRTDANGVIQSTSINPPQAHAMVIQGRIKLPSGDYYILRNSMGSAVFTGKQYPLTPMRGTGLCPASEMRSTVFNQGVMFAVAGTSI